jgi:O-antigen/teichoic acid export membrane protein
LLQLAVFAVLARLIAPEDFGMISLATAVIAVLRVLVESGFTKSLIQIKELGPKDASTAFWTSMGLAWIVYGALFVSAPMIAAWLEMPGLVDVLRVLGLSMPISALSQTPAAILEREFNFKVLSVRQLVAATVGALAAIPVALLGGGVWALVTQTMVIAVVSAVVLWATATWRPRFEYSWEALKRIWPVGLSIMGTELLDAIQGNIDKIVIGIVFTPEVLGYYYLAQRLGTLLMELVTTVISRVSLTTFSRIQDDIPRLNRVFRQMTFAAGVVGVPVFALTALFAPQLIPLLFGEGWEPSIPILWGLAAGWGLAAVMYFDRTVLLARGQAKSAFWLSALQNVVGIGLLFALLPLGILGVVISRWARVFVWPVRLWVMKRAISLAIGRYLWEIVRVILAMLPAGVVVGLLQFSDWARGEWAALTFAAPMGLLAIMSYIAIVWLIAGEQNRAALRPLIGGVRARLRRRRA